MGRFDEGATCKNEQERRQESKPRDQTRSDGTSENGCVRPEDQFGVTAGKSHKRHDHDEGPGRGFSER